VTNLSAPIRTSHVGSFPLTFRPENVRRVIVDLRAIGLDAPPYPQLRSFVDIYLKPLEEAGLLKQVKGVYIAADREGFEHLGRKGIKVQVPEAEECVRSVKELGLGFRWLRAPITGVFTLASRIYLSEEKRELSNSLLTVREIVLGPIVDYVSAYVDLMVKLGFNVVFLDEPALNFMVGRRILFGYTTDDISEVFAKVLKSAPSNIEIGVHVCGRIHRGLFELLASLPRVRYLSLEFHDSPTNIEAVDASLLEKNDKIISPGVVSAQRAVVESVDEATKILRDVYRKAKGRIDLVSGDCGFGGLRGFLGDEEKEYSIALGKLRTVVEAVRHFSAETKQH